MELKDNKEQFDSVQEPDLSSAPVKRKPSKESIDAQKGRKVLAQKYFYAFKDKNRLREAIVMSEILSPCRAKRRFWRGTGNDSYQR